MNKLICCALLCIAFSACKPELRINQDFDIPQDKALNTSQDVENALQSAYAYLRKQECFGGAWLLWPDLVSDNVVYNPNYGSFPVDYSIYNREFSPNDTLIGKSWASAYKAIGIANAGIDVSQRNRISDADFSANKNRFLGEAHFIRGLTLFELALFFAPQYAPETWGSPAIPVPTENYSTLTYLPRKTVLETYTQILNDLQLAASFFQAAGLVQPAKPSDKVPLSGGLEYFNRPNYHIALAMRAKVLMQTGDDLRLEEAISHLNQVLETRNDSVFNSNAFDIRDIGDPLKFYPNPYPLFGSDLSRITFMFANNAQRGVPFTVESRKEYEFLFSIMNFRNDDPATNTGPYFASRYTFNRLQAFFNGRAPYFPPLAPQTNIYRRNTDKRYASFFTNNVNTREVINGVPRPACNKYNSEILNMPILRSADLLLLRSEANTRLGRHKNAIYDLMFVKYRANMAPEDTVAKYYEWEADPAKDNSFLLREIVRERRRELYLEGDRLHTLRRLRLDIPDAERGPGLPWNSEKLVFPVPAAERFANPKLN